MQEEFLKLYNPCHKSFINYCHALTGNREDAKDLVNDTMIRAIENFSKIRRFESFQYYLIGIARRIHFNRVRRQKFLVNISSETKHEIQDSSTSPDTNYEVLLLYQALNKLPEKQKEALILFEITGYSIKEICEIQNSKPSAVKTRLSRGRQKLKELLSDKESIQMIKGNGQKIITC